MAGRIHTAQCPSAIAPYCAVELVDFEERSLALVCRTDRRSSQAAQLLTRQGFADVRGCKTDQMLVY